MGWLTTASGHEVTLSNGKVVARTNQGKILKSLPKALAEDEVVAGLKQLVEWLDRHEASCRAEVDRWMIADAGFVIEGAEADGGDRTELATKVELRRRGPGSTLPANA